MGTLYSHSRLSSFENCRKQFEFRYVLKIPSESESIEAFVGKRVHEILERLYLFVGRGQIPGVEKVVELLLDRLGLRLPDRLSLTSHGIKM